MAQQVKNPPAKAGDTGGQEMQVRSLGRQGPLEEEMATHSSILAWEIPWTEGPGGLGATKSWTRLIKHSTLLNKYLFVPDE